MVFLGEESWGVPCSLERCSAIGGLVPAPRVYQMDVNALSSTSPLLSIDFTVLRTFVDHTLPETPHFDGFIL